MARPRKPTALHELSGAFDHDPARGRARECEPRSSGPLGDPPPCFSELQREMWRELEALAPANVLENADRWLVEIVCRLMTRVRADEVLKAAEYSLIFAALGRMGLTPADRSKVRVPRAAEETNAFADLAADVHESADRERSN